MSRFAQIKSTVIDYLFPPRCASCRTVIDVKRTDAFCEDCRKKWNESKNEICGRCGQPMDQCWCGVPGDNEGLVDHERHLVQYRKQLDTVVKDLIYNLKNSYFERAFRILADEMYNDFVIHDSIDNAVITAVPRNKASIRLYGHDQSYEIAKVLSQRTGIEFVNVLCHKGNVKQKKLGKKQRSENAQKSYSLINGSSAYLKGKTVILIDDVLTTGATVLRCASLLKRRGAEKVIVYTVAKTV